MTMQEKILELQKIAEEIKNFKGLEIAKNAHHPVPGEGNPGSSIMFIGEAPGEQEDLSGHPFVGRSGQMMIKTLTEFTGLTRDQVFITSVVKYRPPKNRDPLKEEIAACEGWLDRQIQIISPKIVVTLGRFSLGKFIPGTTISKIHGQPHQINFEFRNSNFEFIVFPSFHPAAALRGTTRMAEFRADFAKLNHLLLSSLS